MDGLSVTFDNRRDAMVMHLTGSAGFAAADELDRVARMIKVQRPRRLVVDLAGLSFIASLGLGLLVALGSAVRAEDGTIQLVAPRPYIADAIKRCRLERLLPLHDSVDAAIIAS
jgi:anti-sigma B factor antagonist